METSYDVKIYKTDVYRSKKKNGTDTYWVRWRVAKVPPFKRKYSTSGLAESFRSELVRAARTGEAFRLSDGLPVSMARARSTKRFFDFARQYADMKWKGASPGHRRNIAEALEAMTRAMVIDGRGAPSTNDMRRVALASFTQRFDESTLSADDWNTYTWLRTNTREVGDLAQPAIIRAVLDSISSKLDGKPAAQSTARRKRMTLSDLISFAIEDELLTTNPIKTVKHRSTTRKAKATRAVDKRAVPNPVQARTLLWAVREVRGSGRHLEAFFGAMYYAALRPEEARMLNKSDLALPEEGWGELRLKSAAPDIAATWTDSNTRAEPRGLKHRDEGEERSVPCPPELTALLHAHLDEFGAAPDGRLFRGRRKGLTIDSTVYGRTWAAARAKTFSPAVLAGPLARTPYDLRHACVSTWLKAGVEPPRVAAWAGHSLRVLLEVYAKFLDSGEHAARAKIEDALRGG